MARSRLTKQKKKTLYLSLVGIVVIVGLLVVFGIPLLINFSLLVEKNKDGSPVNTNATDDYVVVPQLNATFEATSSAQINITGFSEPEYEIELFVNGKRNDTETVRKNKTFVFRKVELTEGENLIKVRAKKDKEESEFSETLLVIYIKEPPTLEVTAPDNDQHFEGTDSPIRISGNTDEHAKITVNGFWAIVDSNGNFTYTMQLAEGDNQIKVISSDIAGNKTEKDLKVSYSP